MSAWILRLEPDPAPALRDQILAPLARHNEAMAGPGHWRVLAITVRDAEDQVGGGLWGRMGYGFLFVELLALGRRVMAMAETEARAYGLRGMWLDTWTFQAPDFYPKFGFVECGRIKNYPPGHDRIFYVKRFAE